MRVLLVGEGAREHALAWKLAQSPLLAKLWATPGHPGIARHADLVALPVADHAAVVAWAQAERVDLVIVGPEAPLVAGLAGALRAGGIAVFGPSAAAARLEGSKAFTKALCAAHGIPTAASGTFDTLADARSALPRFGLPVVVKADGLAGGKGVTVAATTAEAEAALAALFAEPGARVVIEAFMTGEEASLFALCDGRTALPFGQAQDHKRVGDGDTGPNTGGMGAVSPATVLTPTLEATAWTTIVEPTVAAMAAAGTPFVGMLYAGLMLTAEGPKLVEFNVRLGDPEAEALLVRLDGDLLPLLHAAATGRLADVAPPRFTPDTAVTVVMAAAGYPATPRVGDAIALGDAEDHARVFMGGVREGGGGTAVTAGGRVLAVTAVAPTGAEARAAAYRAVAAVRFDGAFYRHDIGARALPSN